MLYASRTSRQAKQSPGNLGVRVLNDGRKTFWAWTDEAAMKAFMTGSPHLEAMKKLPRWCSEASVVNWIQSEPTFPDWQEAYRRLKKDGRQSKVLYPSRAHETGEISPPRE
jgi:heme-degrading monooxygenase HmoA